MRAKVTFMPSKRANVYAEAEQDIRESAKRMAAVGLQVQVSTLNRAYARHEFISSLDSPYALNPAQRRDATIIGLASAVTSNSDVFSEYRMRNAIDGRDAEAAIGLRNQWTLAEGLHVSTSLERLQAVSGTRRESTAATGGIDFTRLQGLKATTRLEWRQDLTTQSWLSTLGIAERLSSSWTLLAKNYYQWVQQRSAAGQMQNRFSIGGAFRNPNSNRLNMLSRYELRVDRTFGAADGLNIYRRVQSVSTHVDYQPARGWSLSGQHAAKWVDDRTDGTADTVSAQLLSGRLGVDIFSRLDVGALGSVMWGSSGGREQALGAAAVVYAPVASTMPLAALCRPLPEEPWLLTEVVIPRRSRLGVSAHCVRRTPGDAPLVAVAAALTLNDGVAQYAGAAVGGAGMWPTALGATEAALAGQVLSNRTIETAVEAAVDGVSPASDHRASAEYRAHVIGVLLRRALAEAWRMALDPS